MPSRWLSTPRNHGAKVSGSRPNTPGYSRMNSLSARWYSRSRRSSGERVAELREHLAVRLLALLYSRV